MIKLALRLTLIYKNSSKMLKLRIIDDNSRRLAIILDPELMKKKSKFD